MERRQILLTIRTDLVWEQSIVDKLLRPHAVEPGTCKMMFLSPASGVTNNKLCKSKDLWTDVKDEVPVPKDVNEDNDLSTHDIAECLHSAATSLPPLGYFTEIIWLIGSHCVPNISDYVEIYGALKRLVTWNHARVKLLLDKKTDKSESDLSPWVQYLDAQVIDCSSLLSDEKTVSREIWFGSIRVHTQKENINLKGFSLSEVVCADNSTLILRNKNDTTLKRKHCILESKIPSISIDLLARVMKHQIPIYLFTESKFKLEVAAKSEWNSGSNNFLQYLVDHRNAAYLVRLPYSTSWNRRSSEKKNSKDNKDGTKLWKHMILDCVDIKTYADKNPVEGELSSPVEHHQFVVFADDEDTESSCTAYLLHPLASIDGRLGHQVARLQLQGIPGKPACSSNDNLIQNLPHFGDCAIGTMRKDIAKLQIEALKNWIEEQKKISKNIEMDLPTLCGLLKCVRETYVEMFMEKKCFFTERPSIQYKLQQPSSDFQVTAETCLERRALELQSKEQEAKFSKTQSNESLAGMSPPSVNGQVLSLNVGEFLKYFNNDGTASREFTQTIPVESETTPSSTKTVYKTKSAEAKDASWPESCSYNFHDMYYNLDSSANEMEKKCTRLKSRLQSIETTSTCVLEQANSPASLMVPSPAPQAAQASRHKASPKSLKRKASSAGLNEDSQRILLAKKRAHLLKSQSSHKQTNKQDSHSEKNNQEPQKESRSQRHARKLQEVVTKTLEENGIKTTDGIFSACSKRLFQMSKSFVKDLTTSRNLRQEMENIAKLNVLSVIHFEKSRLKQKSKKK